MKKFEKTLGLLGESGFDKLRAACVLIAGVGGVGSAVAETLIRTGVGTIVFVDGDAYDESNFNRQLFATESTLGMNKAEAAALRAEAIGMGTKAYAVGEFITEENVGVLIERYKPDIIADCIDDVKNKIVLIKTATDAGIPTVSAMGAANRLDCSFKVGDIYSTSGDRLAKVIRKKLKDAGVKKLDVVYSETPSVRTGEPMSIAPPPIAMGAVISSHIIGKLVT